MQNNYFARREFKDILKNKYPHLVCRKSPLELWGVETEEGWDNLVIDFIIEIDKYIKDNNIKSD